MWTQGVAVDDESKAQLRNAAKLPFIYKWIAVMPDVHAGKGATVGSVIPTKGAIIPAAVGVDIGCGMMASRTTLSASDLPDNLAGIRSAIERAVPHGRTLGRDKGAWDTPHARAVEAWGELHPRFEAICAKYPKLAKTNNLNHLGTLGTGNHFIEVCLDQEDRVWFMLHSGSRGVGNAIGSLFIELAKEDMRRWFVNLPDADLAYFPEGTRALRRLCRSGAVGAGFRAAEPRGDDGQPGAGGARLHREAVRGGGGGGELPSQLCRAREPLRRERPGDAQGRGARAPRRARHHSRQHGRALVHRPRAGQRRELPQLQPWRRPR